MRARLSKDFTFEAAQTLPNVPADHPCGKMHGHSFKVEVVVEGEVDPHMGWVYDHSRLNEIKGLENPTIENLAAWIWRRLGTGTPACPGVSEIIIHETPTARCIYRGE